MSCLKMYNWNPKARGLKVPDGFSVQRFTCEADIEDWLWICRDGLISEDCGAEKFYGELVNLDGPDPYRDTYFIVDDSTGKKIATFSVVPNMWSSGMGYIHMVACRHEYRGHGIGRFIADYCLQLLIGMGKEKTFLLTGDARVAALATYIKAGFLPVNYIDENGLDMVDRWQKIVETLQIPSLQLLNDDGTPMKMLHCRKVRIGVLGLGRGSFAKNYCKVADNAELVAVCDRNEAALKRYENEGVALYTDYDEFLKHDMDAVVLANFATEHAPFAIKAMRAGKHVLSEVLPFQTIKEGIELMECVEETGMVYAYAENYAYMPCNMEMRRMIKDGTLGKFEYGEGEYLHNCEPGWDRIAANPTHWRNRMYSTFYCTHSIGPMIHIAGQRPVRVSGFEVPHNDRMERMQAKGGGIAVEMITLESGALIKSIHGVGVSKNSYWFCTYGSKGRAECERESTGEHVNITKLRCNIDEYEGQNIYFAERMYYPSGALTMQAHDFGHGGGDFYTMYFFAEKILGDDSADIIDVYGSRYVPAGYVCIPFHSAWRHSDGDSEPPRQGRARKVEKRYCLHRRSGCRRYAASHRRRMRTENHTRACTEITGEIT